MICHLNDYNLADTKGENKRLNKKHDTLWMNKDSVILFLTISIIGLELQCKSFKVILNTLALNYFIFNSSILPERNNFSDDNNDGGRVFKIAPAQEFQSGKVFFLIG